MASSCKSSGGVGVQQEGLGSRKMKKEKQKKSKSVLKRMTKENKENDGIKKNGNKRKK